MNLFSTSILMVVLTSLVHSEYLSEVITSTDDFDVTLEIKNNDSLVDITCNSDFWTDTPAVNFNVSSVAAITFKDCNFPATVNVQSIVDSMKIKVEKELIFLRLQSMPSRENLKGISVPNLILKINQPGDLPFDLLYDVSNLRSLRISAELTQIPDAFFANWARNITEINMSINRIREIVKNDFDLLVNVKNMDLSTNAIDDIEPKAFDSLISLNFLDLSQNSLHTLPLGLFDRMTNLAKIDLSGNSFDELPQNLLENNKNLEVFAMDANQGNLTTLPRSFFKNLIHLKNVSLKRSHWKSLPSDLFVGCSALDHVDLFDNQLTNLPSDFFKDVKNLERLVVGRNRLESLPADIFKGLDRLKQLIIAYNQLTSLTSEVLKDLESLEFLDVSHNRLTRIDDQFITYLKSANQIDLSNNELTFEDQKSGVNSSCIDVSEKQNIQRCLLDPNVKLKHVVISYNKIAQFNVELIHILKYSVSVDLRSNLISKIALFELSSELAKCNETNTNEDRKYSKVYLENNPIHCDCNILEFVNYLKSSKEGKLFDVLAPEKGFKCASPPEFQNRDIFHLRSEELDCSFKTATPGDACAETCVCQRIPQRRVLSVDCSNKNLTYIPQLIGNMQNWFIELNMSSNNLQQSPSLSDSRRMNVISLDLSNNNIATVTLDLFCPNLQHLKLHGNRISRLDTNVLEHLEQDNVLRDLTLHDNKWICDCEAHKLVTFVQHKVTRLQFQKMKCYGSNTKLYTITVGDLCKNIIFIVVIASFLIAFFAIVIASSVVLYYKYKREIKAWLYSKQWCLWFVTEDELDRDKEYDVFISFSHKDEDFVENEIIAKLEKGPRPYKLCLHYRDWLAGEWIPVQISRSVAESRRTIVILTPNFLESVWGLLEFRAAHTQALKEGRNRLIVILQGEIGNIDDLDQEMKDYLRLNTYIKWGDPWFWDKLRYALPHSKEFAKNKMRNVDTIEKHLIHFPLINSCESDVTCKTNVVSMPKYSISNQCSR